jgi:hypothetical protein
MKGIKGIKPSDLEDVKILVLTQKKSEAFIFILPLPL